MSCLGCGTHKHPLRYLTPSLFLSLRLHDTVDKQTRHFVCWLPEQVGGGDEEGGGKERKGGLWDSTTLDLQKSEDISFGSIRNYNKIFICKH